MEEVEVKPKKTIVIRLKNAIHQAVLEQERDRVQALKYLFSLIEKEALRKRKFSEDQVLSLLNGEMKRKKEALSLFKKGGRADLVDQEEKEIAWLAEFLPEAPSDEEVRRVVSQFVKKGLNFGQIMSQVMKQFLGNVSGQQVAKIVKEELGSR